MVMFDKRTQCCKTTKSAVTVAVSVTLLVCVLISGGAIEAKKCSPNDEKEMEQCSVRLETLTDDSFKFPQTIDDMNNYCKTLSKNHECVSKWVKECLGTANKVMAAPVLKNIKESVEKRICKNDESKKEAIKQVACGNDKNLVHFQRLVRASIARMEHLSSKGPTLSFKEKAPYVCCSFRLFQEDIKNTTSAQCPEKQSAENMSKFLIDLTQGAAGTMLEMFCSSFSSLTDCNKSDTVAKYVVELRELTARVKNGSVTPKSKSIMPLVFKLAPS